MIWMARSTLGNLVMVIADSPNLSHGGTACQDMFFVHSDNDGIRRGMTNKHINTLELPVMTLAGPYSVFAKATSPFKYLIRVIH